jgi:hypothetical protein
MEKDRTSATQSASDDPHPVEGNEVYEMFVAELEARRERLRHLLRMVTLEAKRTALPAGSRPRCRRVTTPTA